MIAYLVAPLDAEDAPALYEMPALVRIRLTEEDRTVMELIPSEPAGAFEEGIKETFLYAPRVIVMIALVGGEVIIEGHKDRQHPSDCASTLIDGDQSHNRGHRQAD